ncbi:class IV lanthionine synthetase LanL [Actinocrinis puniceicyclus]|uniref:Class IV lanthionine synthetase LanL n=1 Tax=Actinocrinis puniceicyclus TaxID=977794 RepID=A0A8J7WTH1_9ACTN|nr:class IV lanthionine synthetase LanL [Actinocrinis puniceicyclus]MBS2965400.1 class IV lanthionine synthetase LanL [Actinocrinis puniceicyclus]
MSGTAHAVPMGRHTPRSADGRILEDVVRAAADRCGASHWRLRADGFWFRVLPPQHADRVQGWKLHVSATPLSAPLVLARVAPILIEHRCAFKFARTLEEVFELVSMRASRGSGGKFVTVYPDDDEQLRVLAPLLDEATYELPGPAVLSDRPVRAGSHVFYRYGAFRGVRVLTNDGTYEVRLQGPDGAAVKDNRDAWFNPPPWVPRPFPQDPASAAARVRPQAVLLAGRFEVRAAIRHANRGGVYRALDRESGANVIVKQARAHVGSALAGLDARDVLRHEAAMLERLAPTGLTPHLVSVFEAQDSVFLAEELVAGQSLEQWTLGLLGRAADRGIDAQDARRTALMLVDLVARVHEHGLVLRDLKPGNVMVSEDGAVLRLIDPEYVAVPGTPSVVARTPGYCAPEQRQESDRYAPAPRPSVDLYALGATLCFVATGAHPYLILDEEPRRATQQRLVALLRKMARGNAALHRLLPLICGLMRDEPGERWDLGRARGFLDAWPAGEPLIASGATDLAGECDRVLRDGVDHLCASADFDARPGPWRSSGFGESTDRCSVQHGTAGVLLVLARAAALLGGDRVLETVDRAARALADGVERLPRILPGLLFGSSGTAVALHAAAGVLGDDRLAGRAIDLALRVPVDWPNPDVCHGLAGAGIGQLLMWQATGDPRFEERAMRCARGLIAAADRGAGDGYWPIPRDFDSELAGLAQPGFGHGLAGVAAFLLAAGRHSGDERCLELARGAGRTLVAEAAVDGDGLVLWPNSRGEDPDAVNFMRMHWCSGVSGIGTFLVRLWQATGDERIGALARQAAATVAVNRWQHSPALCHGLAGSGEFLLDLHEADPGGGHLAGAEAVADAMLARTVRREGRLLLADDSLMDVVPDYATGLAGALGFLLRLRFGASRLLTPPLAGAARLPQSAGAVTA